ncbi:Unknown protein [Striga hermonthica]|uniref:Uncharacterized protein n=1 Tax=Striga hermonthica TaxID=68872 RepID=A0A9N7R815_STRHE|nr:Unknown protein [Striga hermonthica]
MANHNNGRFVFPLTSLQIGDLQSYLSHLNLFPAPTSGKLYILVDNRPWLQDLVSRSTHWWQLMVTKSRLSPFANTRGKKEKENELLELEASSSSSSDEGESRSFRNWFSFMDAVMLSRKRALLPVKKLRNSFIANSNLHRTLYGFIVFEIAWDDVRGINYFNELLTDTSLAIEAKIMRRWEFDSISQASKTIRSWFPGTLSDRILLKEHLDATIGEVYHDAQESFLTDNPPNTQTLPDKPNKRRKIMQSIYFDSELGICSGGESYAGPIEVLLKTPKPIDHSTTHEPTLYRDVLILFRFNDHDLPFELKHIIMSKLRLLTLLEAGLPSWVIFLQSYPGFCRLYRPWMCPLARGVYVLISIVTVLIGFYDLYKNVPLLKTAASNLFGPFSDWVEEWEMISRIKYLGTMLFLHNFQKAVKGFLVAARTIVKFVSFFVRPMAEPFFEFVEMFVPVWMMLVRLVGDFFSVVWMVVESCFAVVVDFVEILVLPVWYILMLAWNVASSFIYPIIWVLLYGPFKLILGLYSFVSVMCAFLYDLFDDIWISAKSIFQFTKGVNTTVSSVEVSVWRSLWKDLFSQAIFSKPKRIPNKKAM